MATAKCLNPLDLKKRVWTETGWGDVPPKTGGIIVASRYAHVFDENPIFTVRWDTGLNSDLYANALMGIGDARGREDFEALVLRGAQRARKEVGPNGGLKSYLIYLLGGDWINARLFPELQKKLEVSGIVPVELVQRERKKRCAASHSALSAR